MVFQKLITEIALKLNEAEIPYMLIGGQAVLLYGEPRLTRDIDITLGIAPNQYKKIAELISSLDLKVLVDNPEKFANELMVIPAIDESIGIKVDFIFSFTPYERQAIARGNKVKLGNIEINFASLEDLIIHKIFAGRARDLEDIKNIVLKNPRG